MSPRAILMNLARSCPTSSRKEVSRLVQSSTDSLAGIGSSSTSMVALARVELMVARSSSTGVEMSELRLARSSSRVGIESLSEVRPSTMPEGRVTLVRKSSEGMSTCGMSKLTLLGERVSDQSAEGAVAGERSALNPPWDVVDKSQSLIETC